MDKEEETELTQFLSQVFPALDSAVTEIRIELDKLGCDGIEDLQHVTEEDLLFLKPLRRRKLLAAISERLRTTSDSRDRHETSLLDSSMSSITTIPETDFEDSSGCSTPEPDRIKSVFTIPWHRFPRTVTRKCTSGQSLNAAETREVKRIVSDEMMAVGVTKRAAIRKAAEDICNRYPSSFEDRGIGGTKLGSGYQSLFSGLENRIYNETHKIRKRKAEVLQSTPNESTEDAAADFDVYGCKQGMWLPNAPNEDDLKSQMEMKKELQNLKQQDCDAEEVKHRMSNTYYLQRRDVSSGMPIIELGKQWPFLFNYKCLSEHFYMLTEVNPESAFEESLIARNKGSRIYDYILSGSRKKKSEDLKRWMSIIKAEVEDSKSTEPQLQGVFLLLVNYFEDKEDQLFRFYGVCSGPKRIEPL
eukprot:XP_011663112.1 PREDICTED: uncharacterized protein LOC105437795 [Strongylocentrotus purpuratus]